MKGGQPVTEEHVVHTDADQLREGIDLETDLHYRLVVEWPSLSVEFQMDTEDVNNLDDVYTLFSTDEAETYNRPYTVRDDTIQGDEFLTLTWRGLDPSLNYTLKIDPGIGEDAYYLFTDVPYNTLKQAEQDVQVLNQWENDAGEEAAIEIGPDEETDFDRESTDEEVEEIWQALLEEEDNEEDDFGGWAESEMTS
jgi:hypothetical protein